MKRLVEDYRLLLLTVITLCSFFGCTSAALTKKGDSFAMQGNWHEAYDSYSQGLEEAPGNIELRIKAERARGEAASIHLKRGEELLANKDYDNAILQAQVALALDPSLKRAHFLSVEAKKRKDADYYFHAALDFISANKKDEAGKTLKKALSLNPAMDEAIEALEKLRETRKTVMGGYELNLKSTQPITLKFKNASITDIFDIISQLSGINFIFDDGVKKTRTSIYLENATFEQAMELLLITNNLFQKVVNENTIIIIPDTKVKKQQYEDLLIQTFYLSNLDAKKSVNLLRALLQIKSIYVNEALNAVVIRDTPEVIALADRILKANDIADSEVMLEVEILEVARTNSKNLGLDLSPDTIGWELADPSRTDGKLTYSALKSFSKADMLFSIPDIVINLQKSYGDVNLLANPKIRVRNSKKAKIHIGDRIPIVTVTTNNGVTSDNVQYVDVGVKLNVEPEIHLEGDISLKVNLEISSLGTATTTSNGTTVYQIGTRNAETELRLHDGETQVIGGLINDEERSTTVKVPFLGDIPILGRLFSSVDNRGLKTDILLSITPHITRKRETPEPEIARIWSGKQQEFSSRAPFENFIEKGFDDALPEPAAESPVPFPGTPPDIPAPQPPGEGVTQDEG